MKTDLCFGTPIARIWHVPPDGKGRMWDRDQPQANDLTDLDMGEEYTVTADSDYLIDRNHLEAGTSQVVWNVKLGKRLNYAWWSYARDEIKGMQLWSIFKACDVKEIRVVEQFPPEVNAPADTQVTVYGAQRAILFLDQPFIPAFLFVETLLHEPIHIWELDNGMLDGQKRNELMAYMMNQLYHFLKGDGLNIFDDPVNHPYAYYLKGQTWD